MHVALLPGGGRGPACCLRPLRILRNLALVDRSGPAWSQNAAWVAPQLGSCASSWRGREARRPDTAWKVRASRRFRRCSPSRRTSPAALSLAETRSCPRPRQPPNRWPRRSRALVADSWRSGLVPLLLMQMPHLWGREMSDPSAPITNGAHWAARSPPAPQPTYFTNPCSVPRIKYVVGNLVPAIT